MDTAITLARQVLKGERWYEAHREHFYQRLVRAVKSHVFVTGWEMGLQVLTWLLMVAYLKAGVSFRLSLVLGVFAIVFGSSSTVNPRFAERDPLTHRVEPPPRLRWSCRRRLRPENSITCTVFGPA